MNHFFIVTNKEKDPELKTTKYICDFIKQHDRQVEMLVREELGKYACRESNEENPLGIPRQTECILVLGGDGTLLQTARDTLQLGIPLLGINLGTLGFLAEVEKNGITDALQKLIQDDYSVEERMLLEGAVLRGGTEIWKAHALNDVVVNRSGRLMVLSYDVYVNGQFLNRYQADGMILSTPTGSTGYNLSAGGPIVEPGAKMIVMTPICPHTLNTRSIVLSASDTVEIEIGAGRNDAGQQAEINFDGGLTKRLETGDHIIMQKSDQVVRLIRLSNVSFLEMLHKKMSEK
jgi:NAD+ kinase